MKWTDATSYSKGQRGVIEHTAWQCLISGKRIWISNAHRYFPGLWVMNAEAVGIKEHRLCDASEPPERAQQLALSQFHVAAVRLSQFIASLAEATEQYAKHGDDND